MAYCNELYHYGIPGMKWGVRRAHGITSSSGGTNRSGSRKKSIDKRKLARNLLIGAGTAAAIGGAAYGVHRLRKSGKMPQMPDVYRDNLNVRKLGGQLQAKIGQKNNNKPLGLPNPANYALSVKKNKSSWRKVLPKAAAVATVPASIAASYAIRTSGEKKNKHNKRKRH